MPSSIPHEKFYFYHLPTRGQAGIKLGDAWYVSNVSIIFDCSMLYYLLSWMFIGFIIHFYIIFGTNLLTQSPVPVSVFSLFLSTAEKETKRSPIDLKPSGTWFLERTRSRRHGPYVEQPTGRPRGRGAPTPPGAPSTLVGPCCSTDVLLPPIYTYVPPNYQIRSQNPNSTAVTFCIHEIPSWGLFRSSAGGGHRSRRASISTP